MKWKRLIAPLAVVACSAVLIATPAQAAPGEKESADAPSDQKPVDAPGDEKPADDWEYSLTVKDWLGPDYIESMQRQSALIDWIDEQDPDHKSGYLYTAEGPTVGSVDIAWSGDSDLRSGMAEKAQELNLSASFTERPFDWPTVDAQARAIMDQQEAYSKAGFMIRSIVALDPEATDMVVQGVFVDPSVPLTYPLPSPDAGKALPPEITDAISENVLGTMRSTGPVPVRLSTENLPEPSAGRNDDYSPFWGGGLIRSWSRLERLPIQ